jgi:three-Cys-motif partner protein
MNQGQGSNTTRKESAFRGIFAMNLAVQKKRRHLYYHFDLNAGSGYNELANCDGSPIVFLNTALAAGVSTYRAHFVDSDDQAVRALLERITDERATVHHGDNAEFVRAIPRLIKHYGDDLEYALGSILCDPNGTGIPIDELARLSQQCPRLDIILNYGNRGWKRARGAHIESAQLVLEDLLSKLQKKYWHIQEPPINDPQEWMILIGRNFLMGDWQKMGIFNLDSPKGKEILRRSLTIRESTYSLF